MRILSTGERFIGRAKTMAAGCLIVLLIAASAAAPVPQPQAASPRNPFFAYNFGGLSATPVVEQVHLLQRLGYDGISLGCESDDDLRKIDDYIAAANHTPDAFRVFGVYVFYNFKAAPAERDRWRSVLAKLKGRGIDLWLIIGPRTVATTDDDVAAIIATVADAAAAAGTRVTLYPHSKCGIASAEAAIPFLQRLNRPNLGLAVHLCHELRAGNGDRLETVVRRAAPYLHFASVAGADAAVDWTTPLTMDHSTIKPLDESSFDLARYLRALRAVDFHGPIGFINFKIEQDPVDYLARSIRKWRELTAAQ